MDKLSPDERSKLMAKVKSKNTKPELLVRKLIFSLGYRYRLHSAKLPGSPDLVFSSRKKVIFVHGCFWHRHEGCRRATTPQSKQEYWNGKFARTVERDRANIVALKSMGWDSLVLWECELKNIDLLKAKLVSFLNP